MQIVWVTILFHECDSVDSNEDGITAVRRLTQGIRFWEMDLAFLSNHRCLSHTQPSTLFVTHFAKQHNALYLSRICILSSSSTPNISTIPTLQFPLKRLQSSSPFLPPFSLHSISFPLLLSNSTPNTEEHDNPFLNPFFPIRLPTLHSTTQALQIQCQHPLPKLALLYPQNTSHFRHLFFTNTFFRTDNAYVRQVVYSSPFCCCML